MFLVAILWGVIVGNLVSTTKVYQDCKNTECKIQVNKVGYEIVKKGE